MIRTLIMAGIAVLIASSATYADKNFLLFGVGSSSGAAAANCGTGVIDLSGLGCTISLPLGLVP
jgi:hypothetical protein